MRRWLYFSASGLPSALERSLMADAEVEARVDEAVSEERRAATLARVWERMAPRLAEEQQPEDGVQVQGYPEHVRRAYREGRW